MVTHEHRAHSKRSLQKREQLFDPVAFHPMRWAAGVLEASGRIWAHPTSGGAYFRTGSLPAEVAATVQRILGGRLRALAQPRRASLEFGVDDQLHVARSIAPYVCTHEFRERLSALLRYRLVDPGRRPGLRRTQEVRDLQAAVPTSSLSVVHDVHDNDDEDTG